MYSSSCHSVQMLFDIADPVYGGIKGEPKFPLGYQADFLLQYAKANNDSRSLFYVELTLQMMARGGIYDQLGGGFSRYSIDEMWHVPHFEKMLYDNAILSHTYLQAFKYTNRPIFGQVAKETLDYVISELRGKAFFSAEDADSEGQEGKFYVWSCSEIVSILKEDAELFCQYFGVTEEGNFEGHNVLHVAIDGKELADTLGISEDELHAKIENAKQRLCEARRQKPKPFKDDKIITSWNGLMVHALAWAGFSFPEENYLSIAEETVSWMKTSLFNNGELLRRYRDGDARFSGGLDDYAFLIRGLLSLFEVTGSLSHLKWAEELCVILHEHFKAPEGAFYQTKEGKNLLIRKCEFYDGAEPSGNAVHTENLVRLYQLTQKEEYLTQIEDVLRASKSFIQAFPPGACYHLIALQKYFDQNAPILVIALDENRTNEQEIRKALGSVFCPHAFFVWKYPEDSSLQEYLPSLASQGTVEGKTAVHICRATHCEAPLTDMDQILEAIEHL